MIYVDLNAELQERIRDLESVLDNLTRARSESAGDALAATARDLQRCQRWLALLGGAGRTTGVPREAGRTVGLGAARGEAGIAPRLQASATRANLRGAPAIRA